MDRLLKIGNWLRTEEFDPSISGIFVKWNAKAMLFVSEAFMMREVPGNEGERL